MDATEILTLIVILISSALVLIKFYSNDCVWFLIKRYFLEIYCFLPNNSIAQAFKELYIELKSKNYKSANAYICLQPFHMLVDKEVIKLVFQTNFEHFTSRGLYFNKIDGNIDENVFNALHDEWKFARTKLAPAFTPAKIKNSVEQIKSCSRQLIDAINSKLATQKDAEVDITDLSVKYASKISRAFLLGIDSNSFEDERNKKCYRYASRIITGRALWRNLQYFCAQVFPALGAKLGIFFVPKETAKYFVKSVDEIVNYRQQNGGLQDSMLKLMMDLRNKGDMTMKEIAAHCLILYTGSFETLSRAFVYCLYELAKNQTIQEELRDEINRTYENNEELTYETLITMEYLERVISETLRKHPSVHTVARKCTKDYKVPNTSTLIQKDTVVLLSVLGLHHDPEHYPDPLKFDPDRFIPELVENRSPFSYMPFGAGPRGCFGRRFALIQLKLGLVAMLRNFKFSLNENTIEPQIFKRFLIFLTTQRPILLTVEKVQVVEEFENK